MFLMNHASTPDRMENLVQQEKLGGRPAEKKFIKKSEILDRVISFRESIIARIIREPGLDLLNSFKMD